MPGQDDYPDDYVAELLKNDAKATSSAAMNSGLGSLLSKRPTASAPKPNTRFLKNLIRDTDSHNAALLAREAEESAARLRRLRDEKRSSRGKPDQQLYSARGRQHGGVNDRKPPQQFYSARSRRNDIAARPEQTLYSARSRHDGTSGPPAKRRRMSHDLDEETRERRHDREEIQDERRRDGVEDRRARDASEDRTRERSKRHRNRSASLTSDDQDDRHGTSNRKHDSHNHKRRRSRSPDRARDRDRNRDRDRDDGDHHRSRHHRSTSRTRHDHEKRPRRGNHSSSPESLDRRKPSQRYQPTEQRRRPKSPASDSDPLEAILGPEPPPPIRSKGRGAFNRSTMDAHFAANYDPSADVTPDAENVQDDDDWENALEALRDRQKWRTQGAERLRAAGFSEEHIEKWQNQKVDAKGERVMDESDVKWNKRGEDREWDRGKEVDDESGQVNLKPEWGRLKGT